MDSTIFAGGTAPGSPTSENEIKTLLCYLLAEVGRGMTFEQLHETLREDHLVNYFELVEALDSLVKSEHLAKTTEETPSYSITPLGEKTAQTLDNSLPYSVREKAVEAAKMIADREKRLDEVNAEITTLESGGFLVEMAIPEGDTDLIAFRVFAPTKEEARRIRMGFLNDPVYIYQAVMSLLSGDLTVLGDLTPETRKLFK